MAQQESKLGMLAAIARKSNIVKNGFNGESDANNYSATHTKAMSDQETPIQGKGTGIYLDTYNGGGDMDINGNPMYAGSGRLAAIANNTSKWGYGPSSPYTAPDTGNPSSPSGGVV
tara:strand:+ start:5067 stop:5414 length:348 start_codon:yes stop_codon:yes gene_type:complete